MQFVVSIVSCVVVILVVRIIALQWYGVCVNVWRAINPGYSSPGVGYIGVLFRASNYNWGKELSFIMQGFLGR